MDINTQYVLRNNPHYIEYIRYNSYWYKNLTRDPSSIELLIKEYKEYKRRERINKITNTLEQIELLENIISMNK